MMPTIEGSPSAVASRDTSAATITAITMPIISWGLLPRMRWGPPAPPFWAPKSPDGGCSNRASSVDEDRRAQRNAPHENLQVAICGPQAARGARLADAPRSIRTVYGQAVAAAPAGRQVRLVAGQREDAAAVIGPVVAA